MPSRNEFMVPRYAMMIIIISTIYKLDVRIDTVDSSSHWWKAFEIWKSSHFENREIGSPEREFGIIWIESLRWFLRKIRKIIQTSRFDQSFPVMSYASSIYSIYCTTPLEIGVSDSFLRYHQILFVSFILPKSLTVSGVSMLKGLRTDSSKSEISSWC